MIQSIIFDLDGTLLDRNRSLYSFVADQYDRLINHAKNVEKDRYINRFIELDNRGYVWKDVVYQELIKEFDLSLDWNEMLADYVAGFCKHAVPFSNTYEILDKLQSCRFKLGMITNGFGDFQSSNIDALGIREYFEVILISELEGLRKPDPAIFHRAANRLNVRPEECVYVGDHPINDVIASRNAGMKGVWKEDLFYSDEFECDGIARDLLDLEHIIEQWNVTNK